jgi:translation initiation factor 4A
MAESMNTSERSERSEQSEQSEPGERVISDRNQKFYTENVVTSFEDLNLKETLLRGVYSYGFELPSAIQQKAILPVLDGHDVIGQAQSGTGKTATFTIGMLQRIDEHMEKTQAIILTHTRELALQVKSVATALSSFMNIKINLTIGGISIRDNINELLENPHIVIGTPGRVLDMINKKALSTKYLKLLIVDEADEMLSKIFLNQIYDIFRFLPGNIQVGLFSATMPVDFFDLTNKFMRDPIQILVKTDELTLEGIKQYYINVERNEFKFDTICDLYEKFSVAQSIIYCNSKKIVDDLDRKLNENGFSVNKIHGRMTQDERNVIMKSFRDGDSRILVSTDLLCRGIDVQQVSVVINYDIPHNVENYLHRIGRSGRFGRKGLALNFMTYYDIKNLHEIEKYYSTQIQELPALTSINDLY